MPLLEVDNLSIKLRAGASYVDVVSSLNISIEPGRIFGLAGESGCGKSLTALSIMGLLPESMSAGGAIRFRDKDLLKFDPGQMRKIRGREIAMVFQEPMTSLNPVLRIGYQIREVITTHMNIEGREADRMVVDLLRAVQIPEPEMRAREYPHQLSGGMRQRIMMAMAIACKPALLIADEPTTALDVTIQAQLLDLIDGLRKETGMSVLFITHDLSVISEEADEAAIMYAGRIMEQAPVRELFSNPRHPYTIGLLGSLPKGKGVKLNPIPGFVPKPGQWPTGCKFSNRCSYRIDICGMSEPELKPMRGGNRVRCFRADEVLV